MNADRGAIVTGTAALELSAAPVDLEERFSDFVVSHRDRARRLAWRLIGGDEDAAEDVVQDAFVRAYRALGRFREDSSLETWFYRILVNQAHKHRRWRVVRQREAFVLVHFEGFTVRETGNLLGAPEGTVKSHLHRALKALRIELADLQDLTARSQP